MKVEIILTRLLQDINVYENIMLCPMNIYNYYV